MIMKNDEFDRYKEDLWELEARLSSRRRFETILKLYTVMGVLISIFALAYFLLSMLDIELTQTQQLTLLIAGTGLALSLTSWAMLLFRKKIKALQSASEIIYLWAEFEDVGKNILNSNDVEYNRHSIRQVISLLTERDIISQKESVELEEIMQMRNAAAHGRAELAPETVLRAKDTIREIISKVNSANT
jgi:uncharacterized protein YutE (UPF0331/DUF86 family)